ncbi:UDP-glucose--hexose-1-phosphate uridylyltransferase [Candidatus Haliotispira prima]|uniref:Galactose-1-phosphate uridylyltransferase n=1 Tax=Candidatus Haliotispira prima TaxID=3034016 RepID=A0ABY8MJV5_9SPIO|nr:UDP-glucose--hexose-1-phosphate uridylyltransferase [Candidatus Haliotispira prima]
MQEPGVRQNRDMDICLRLERLLDFAREHLLLESRDRVVVRHRLYLFLGLEGFELQTRELQAQNRNGPVGLAAQAQAQKQEDIYSLTAEILCWAAEQKLYDGESITDSDLFLANLLGQLLPLASRLEQRFWQLYRDSPSGATEFFYRFSTNAGYIRSDRLARNFSWDSDSAYGRMEITINLSKPEKDPKTIAAAGRKESSGYPKCVLCPENEGYPGHRSWAPRFNHRVIELELDGKGFAMQYSPYLYYPEHSILLSREHRPMVIDREAFAELFDFVRRFPHYMAGSNADLPIVGGSILSHHHFQAGCYEFPMFRAPAMPGVEELQWLRMGAGSTRTEVRAEILQWPLSCLRLSSSEISPLLDLGRHVLECWRSYSDESIGIQAHSDAPHNTITPIVRRTAAGIYQFFLVLRNNRTDERHPLGLYHPHSEIHHIKKENIGLIEVMGLAILPGRLKEEMRMMEGYLAGSEAERTELRQLAQLQQHLPWLDGLLDNSESSDSLPIGLLPTDPAGWKIYIRARIAEVFAEGLSHCGVLKDVAAWSRFLHFCGLTV